MKHRPWTEHEIKRLRELVNDLGLAEVLFGLANMVATDHPDFNTGVLIRDGMVKSGQLILATWEDSPMVKDKV
jgi:hypothetical protein